MKHKKAQQDYEDKFGGLAERDEKLQDSLQEHEDLIAQAANALKQVTSANSKQVKNDLQSKQEALTAGAQAAADARKKKEADKVKNELEAQRKAAHEKSLLLKKN